MTSATETTDPRAIARVDLDAISDNCRLLKGLLGDAELCAVVKADGYGHGALASARAALAGGATWLAVVTAAEAALLREQGFDQRLLVMGALDETTMVQALAADADVVVWRPRHLERVVELATRMGCAARLHVKLDTGMGRLGTRDPEQALALIDRIATHDQLEMVGLMTHFATADEADSDFFDEQLARFRPIAERVKAEHPSCVMHAANSAAVLRDPESHFDMARCGIAIYGLDPLNADPAVHGLRPALSLESYVADVKRIDAGESVGYGRSWSAERETDVAVLPIGYGDGFRRALGNHSHTIIEGRRYPVVGTVSMDNITVDLGPESTVQAGAPAVLIGTANGERILAEDLATQLGTINYEITCGISQRVARIYAGG